MHPAKKLAIFSCVLFLSSCSSDQVDLSKIETTHLSRNESVKHAKRFTIFNSKNFRVIYLLANAKNTYTTDTFVLYDSVKPYFDFAKNVHYIKTPCKRILALSSIYTNMLTELGCLSNIKGIENVDYYNNANIINAVESGKIVEVQKDPDIDREKVLKMNPDIIFAFGMNQNSNDFDIKIVQAGIPVVMCLDHLERTPLARAEWIKFYAAFVNKSSEADIIFAEVEKDYEMLKKMSHIYTEQPSVLTELKLGDTWYVPGGKSFMAQLIKDANANYIWSNDTASGSLPLSFETVYKKAQKADYWLNVSLCTTKEQVLEQDERYANFEAFKRDAIYNNNLNCNKLKYSNYWETGMMYPNRILSDMIQIFHPKAKSDLHRQFYYYRKLN